MLEPQAAATVMIVRETSSGLEVFMLRRSSRSAFMPDVYVFPGGRVEAADAAPAVLARLAAAPHGIEPPVVVAAVRETFEECGLFFGSRPIAAADLAAARERLLAGRSTFDALLAGLDLGIDAGGLRYFSRWITPPLETRRFDTHFFVARAPIAQTARADASETHDGLWIRPQDALARLSAGTFALIFPTIKHLERLTEFDSVDALLAYAAAKPIAAVMPDVDADRGLRIPTLLEGAW